MTRATALFVALLVLGALWIAGMVWGARRTHNAADYLVASRRLSSWLTALSYCANAMPPWLLFVVLAAAFAWGVSAVWLALALFAGSLLNWFVVAPRLRQRAAGYGSLSVVQAVGIDIGERLQAMVVRTSALLLIVAFTVLIASQLRLLGAIAAAELGSSATAAIIFGAAAYALYVAVGGYWAASLADALAMLALLVVAALLLVPATIAVGGIDQVQWAIAGLGEGASDPFGARTGVVALAFVIGSLGLGLALPGQPHALSRFIAARDEASLRRSRWLAVAVSFLMLAVMLFAGWCAQALYGGLRTPELALVALATRMLPPGLGGVLALGIASTVLISIGGHLLMLASLLAVDLKRKNADVSLVTAHVATVGAAVLAACIALYAPVALVDQSLFAFTMLGASFGPLVLVRLAGKRIRPGPALGAMWAGAILTLLFHLLPDSPGDFLERVLPFVAALGIALTGGERRSNPDRADRAQQTVHDRVPI